MNECTHPKEKRRTWHDCAVLCEACGCIIEQFKKPIIPPSPLVEKSTGSTTDSTAALADTMDSWITDIQAALNIIDDKHAHEILCNLADDINVTRAWLQLQTS